MDEIKNDLNVVGVLNVDGDFYINGCLRLDVDLNVIGDLIVNGCLRLDGYLNITGDLIVTGDLYIFGAKTRFYKLLRTNRWNVYVTETVIKIGCLAHTVDEWRGFSDEEIGRLDKRALEFWRKNKVMIFDEHKKLCDVHFERRWRFGRQWRFVRRQ